jgi:transcriptional antiterminator NusG
MSSRWYVLRAISGQEKKVKQYIESELRRLNFESHVEQILIPIEKVLEMRNGKKRTRERSMYPGYIYIHFGEAAISDNQVQPELIEAIRDVPGAVGFLGDEKGKQPTPMREAEINRILGKVSEMNESSEIFEYTFQVGETVKIMDGPFVGFSGVIEEVHEDKKKLKVTVKIFGRNTPLELNFLQVERFS